MRRAQLQAMMSAASPTEKELKALIDSSSGESTKRQKAIDDAAQAVKCYEYLCKAKNAKKLATLPATDSCKTKYKESDPCQEISKSRKKLEEASQAETEAQSVSDMMKNNLEAYKSTNPSLNAILVQLNNEIDELQKKYESAPTEAPILRKASGKGEMSGEEIAQNWMAFTFDSEKSSKSRDTSSSTTKVAASTSFFAQFTLGAGMSYSRSHQEFHEKMSSSDVSVSAKLLRVTINRNWFRPSIFRNSNLFKMVSFVTVL